MINLFSIDSSTFRSAKYVFEYFISLRFSLASWTLRTLIHNLFIFYFEMLLLNLRLKLNRYQHCLVTIERKKNTPTT